MKTKILVKWASKRIEKDNYKKGCSYDTSRELDLSLRGHVFDSLEHIEKQLGLERSQDAWLSMDGRIIYQREENDNGDTPSKEELTSFRAGKRDLWLVDYDFSIELIQVLEADESKVGELLNIQVG